MEIYVKMSSIIIFSCVSGFQLQLYHIGLHLFTQITDSSTTVVLEHNN